MRKTKYSLQPTYVGKIGHDLKTPLSSVKAFLQIIKRRIDNKNYDEISVFLEKIDIQADKLNHLIAVLINLLRLEKGNLEYLYEYIQPSQVIKEQLSDLKITYKFGTKETITSEILFDPTHFKLIIRGLFSYIKKITGENSLLHISDNYIKNSSYEVKILVGFKPNKFKSEDFDMEYELAKRLLHINGGKIKFKNSAEKTEIYIKFLTKPKKL